MNDTTHSNAPAAVLSTAIDNFLDGYEMHGEDASGRQGCYTPNERERALLTDAIHMLLDDDEFREAYAKAAPASVSAGAQEPVYFERRWKQSDSYTGKVDEWSEWVRVHESDIADMHAWQGRAPERRELRGLYAGAPQPQAVQARAPGESHASDCARHNAPAYPVGACDCGVDPGEALVAEVAAALELVRARDIVEQVRRLPVGGHDADMPTPLQAGYALACDEIAARLGGSAQAVQAQAAGDPSAMLQWLKDEQATAMRERNHRRTMLLSSGITCVQEFASRAAPALQVGAGDWTPPEPQYFPMQDARPDKRRKAEGERRNPGRFAAYTVGQLHEAHAADRAARGAAAVPADALLLMVLDDMATCYDAHGCDYEFRELSTETVEAFDALRESQKSARTAAPVAAAVQAPAAGQQAGGARDAARYRYWRAGNAVNVTIPVVRDGKPKPITVMLSPNPQQEWGDALDAAIDAALAATPAPEAEPAPVLQLQGIDESDGFWRSCSGCHELNEGHATGPFSPIFKCALGNGCRECGGIGAVWDDTDYAAMGDYMASAPEAEQAAPAAVRVPSDEQLLEVLQPYAKDGGRWPSDWLEAGRACIALAAPQANQADAAREGGEAA